MTFDKVYQLLKSHRTVTLITADNAALIISFLFKSFKQNQNGFKTDTIAEKELTEFLSDYLYFLNKYDNQFTRQPKQYLTDWTNAGYLRKYPTKNDVFLYELTAATENAFKLIDSLDKREFVGQESRLKNLFESLKELSNKSKRDSATRMKVLLEKKKQIEQEIQDVENGKMDVLDDRQIKEQYFLIEETAKNLLADFRQVEQNFRELDRRFRQKIITTTLVKGDVLEDLFQQQANIFEEDQGKSFTAFWEFLLSHSKQEEFEKLISEVLNIPVVQEVQSENFSIANVRNNLIEAGDKTKKSTNSLLEQLRKYLEHKSFFENKRIYDNIQEALKIIGINADKDFTKLELMQLDEVINIDLIIDRPLFTPPEKVKFANNNPEEGKNTGNNNPLFEQFEISIAELKSNIKVALKNKSHISFSDFVKAFEIKKGVAEIVAYVEIAANEKNRHIVKEDQHDFIDIKNSKTNKNFRVKVPQIVFCK
ncbi:MAG: DUF3375 domain-containing protein [Flavobacterium sp.]|nr:DUF3375 domain-containing protein [Flavobacterium sp.]